MIDIESYTGFLPDDLIRAWPRVAICAKRIGGVLMGGTAVAIHLRHRTSEDLDVMTLRRFSGLAVKRNLEKSGEPIETVEVAENMFHGVVDNVKVDIFRALPTNEVQPSSMDQIAPTTTVSDMEVGSLPDLLATKLDVILYRPKLRDYIDLAAIDQLSAYNLESGLVHYCHRYGYEYPPRVLERVIGLLADPGYLPSDSEFSAMGSESLDYLKNRVPDLQRHFSWLRGMGMLPPHLHRPDDPNDGTRSARTKICGRMMPKARKRCVLPLGHSGSCRSRRS